MENSGKKELLSEEIKPYDLGTSKKKQMSRMFNNIAPYYDFLNHFLTFGIDIIWRKRAISRLNGMQVRHLLDIATGTADLAIMAAKRIPEAQIIGVDISPDMLQIGRQKITRKNLSDNITLETGDSENLAFTDNTFDAITVGFGVRNFENVSRGLQEMYRVLKPGGRLVVLEFSRPVIFPFKQLYHFYFRNILPLIGRITSKDPKAYTYLYESVMAFPDGKDFMDLLQKNQFTQASSKPQTLGICTIYTALKA